MSNRLKILDCKQIERIENNILDEVQIRVIDRITKKFYKIICYLISIVNDCDYYTIEVYSIPNNQLIDTCRIDSSGGSFMEDDFNCDVIDNELGAEIIELLTNHFIVEF